MNKILFIDGDQGTTGLDLQNRLRGHAFDVRTLPAELRKEPEARREALNDCDFAVLCLPDAAAREAVGWITNAHVRVVDASSGHRINADWVYGLPELDADQPARIAAAARVSNPGCYPTAAVALLRPLRDAGLLPAEYPVTIQAVSGYSGKGRAGVQAYESDTAAAPALQLYGLGLEHKHVPEIQKHANLGARPLFLPAYGAYRQGIVLTVGLHLRLLPAEATIERIHSCLADRYSRTREVEVLPLAAPELAAELDPQTLNGTNRMQLTVAGNTKSGQVVLCAVLDNLGKGAAGAALQNLELMAGHTSR